MSIILTFSFGLLGFVVFYYDVIDLTQANPPQLHSNLVYIQRYRRQTRLVSEAAYFFTNILSAESFVWNINGKSLSMEETEFQKKMELARAQLLGLSTETVHEKNKTTENVMENVTDASKSQHDPAYAVKEDKDFGRAQLIGSRPAILDLEKKGAADLLTDGELTENFKDYPYLYANAGDLTVDDVESLLSCYKKLVLKYVCLTQGMGISASYTAEPNSELDAKLENASCLFDVAKGKTNNGKHCGSRIDDVALKITTNDPDSPKDAQENLKVSADSAKGEMNNKKDLSNSDDNTTVTLDDAEPKVAPKDTDAHTSTERAEVFD